MEWRTMPNLADFHFSGGSGGFQLRIIITNHNDFEWPGEEGKAGFKV